MSFAFVAMTMLLGSSVVIAFVLQPSKEEPTASDNFPVSHHRCQDGSLQSIKKGLLRALNLQLEPQLPAGGLDGVRDQWRSTFSTIAHRAYSAAAPAASGISVPSDEGNNSSLKCCSMTSEIFMKDLGWDSWVIHPASLTIVHCAICNPEAHTMQCPPSHTNVHDANSQVPCCQPTTQETVPVLYVDEFSTVVISSMQLTRSCGCEPDNLLQPSRE